MTTTQSLGLLWTELQADVDEHMAEPHAEPCSECDALQRQADEAFAAWQRGAAG